MKIIKNINYEELSENAARFVCNYIKVHQKALISFPAGDTPKGMIECFVKLVNSGDVDISNCGYISLDEWVSLGVEDKGSCAYFLKNELFDKLKFKFKDVFIFDGKAKDLETECKRANNFINDHGGITLSVLGVGMNGHLGFNEPGADFKNNAYIAELDNTTKSVMKKYFDEEKPLTMGITQGLGQILSTETVLLLASGIHKKDIVNKVINGAVSNQVPASLLRNHKNAYFYIDEDCL